MRYFSAFVLTGLCVLVTAPAIAHEYYLLPDTFVTEVSEPVALRHRLGQRFNGNEMSYIHEWNVRSEVWEGGEKRERRGVDGDRPALTVTPNKTGLMAVVHQSNHSIVNFGWEKFETYVLKEGMTQIPAAHDARGLSRDGKVREAYARFAKTLVAVGDGAGEDVPRGLKIEIVALGNPYTLEADKPLPVQVLFDGKPLPSVMIKVFSAIDSENSGRIIADENGRAEIPAKGPGPYLLNAVHMLPPVSPEDIAQRSDWESFWASLTFQRGLDPIKREERRRDRKPLE